MQSEPQDDLGEVSLSITGKLDQKSLNEGMWSWKESQRFKIEVKKNLW